MQANPLRIPPSLNGRYALPAPQAPPPTAPEQPLLLTYAQAAALLQLSERTVWALVRSGELPAVRVGVSVRIDRADLLAWIDRRKRRGDTGE